MLLLPRTLLCSLFIFGSIVTHAGTVPAISGKIENLSSYRTQDLKIKVTWYCVNIGAPDVNCKYMSKSIQARVNANGTFRTPSFTTPRLPYGDESATVLFVTAPNGNNYYFRTYRNNACIPAQRTAFFQLNKADLTLRLANGADFNDWVQNESPQRSLIAKMMIDIPNLHNDLDNESFIENIQDENVTIPAYFGAFPVASRTRLQDINMKLSLAFSTYDWVELATITYDGPLNRNVLSSLSTVDLDNSQLNTSPTGVWTGNIVADMVNEYGFAFENLEAKLDVTCTNNQLSGTLTAQIATHVDPPQVIPVSGVCRNGHFSFDAQLNFRRYMRSTLVTVPLHFEANSIDSASAFAELYSKRTGNKAGFVGFDRRP